MDGLKAGAECAAEINEAISRMMDKCGADQVAVLKANTFISHILSESTKSPLVQQVRRNRKGAIDHLKEADLSDEEISQRTGVKDDPCYLSRTRVQQLRTSDSEGARKSEQRGHRKAVRPPVQMETLPGFDAA